PAVQAYWDHYQQGTLEQHLKYVEHFFCHQRQEIVPVDNIDVIFPYHLRQHPALQNLLASPELKDLLQTIHLLLENDAERIMQDYDVAISDQDFARDPKTCGKKLKTFQEKVLKTPAARLPFLLQKLQENKDFQNWTFGSPRQDNSFRKFIRGTIFFWESHAITDLWAKIDPVVEEYTYQNQPLVIIRHFQTKIEGKNLEFYLTTNTKRDDRYCLKIVRYGEITTNEENPHALATTKSIFYEGNYKNINLAARLANSTPEFTALAKKAQENDTLENKLLRDQVMMGHRLKRLIWSNIFLLTRGQRNKQIDVNGHPLYWFKPNAYRLAPYRTNLDRNLNGTRLIKIVHHHYNFIAAAFEDHAHYEKWLNKNRGLADSTKANELSIFYTSLIQPLLDYRDQNQYQQQYQNCAQFLR
ncbi:MAG: hypothetical protein J6Y94_02675, partial [Bacteriovoracaceae bacterium]|nr:hypothetical protein [Bacteriovoracaceae bacterium]